MKTKLYRDIKLKDGTILKKGREVYVFPREDYDQLCHIKMADTGELHVLKYSAVIDPPDIDDLMSQDFDGLCESIDGEIVEPDGHSPDGYPSWLLALGLL